MKRPLHIVAAIGALCACGSEPGGDMADAASAFDAVSSADACATCPATPMFVGSWGGLGTAPGLFFEPSSVELDSQGVVIVAGHEDRVQRFTRDGELIDIFGTPGAGDGQFNHPHGLAVDRDRGDLLYVGDQENHRLQVFTSDGQFVRQWGDDQFQHIHDVGIDRASGDIFVGDLELHILRKFSSTGELLATYGGLGSEPGKFNRIWGMSTDSTGFVYIADQGNQRVQKLDGNGGFVKEWNSYGGTAFIKPTGIYVDHNDTIYVCDSLAQTIVLFDTDGAWITTWDLTQIYGERSEPEDIVIDAAGKHIYIAEVYDHSVLHLEMP